MDIPFSLDLISDLNLSDDEQFDWTGNQTSLFCIVAGNVAPSLRKLHQVLTHLGTLYRGVLYIDGQLEHQNIQHYESRVDQIKTLCAPIQNVIYLHQHVVILNGIAFVAINGWYPVNYHSYDATQQMYIDALRIKDLEYLTRTIKNLQSHNDAKRICVITNSIPSEQLTFKDPDNHLPDPIGIIVSLMSDINHKVDHWVFGNYNKIIDGVYNGRRYVNNPKLQNQPYWPKRIVLG
jgi:hypothetical protein